MIILIVLLVVVILIAAFAILLHAGVIRDKDQNFVPDRIEESLEETKKRVDELTKAISKAIDDSKKKK